MTKFSSIFFCLLFLACKNQEGDSTKHLFQYKAKIVSDLVLEIDTTKKGLEVVPKAIADGFDKLFESEYLDGQDSTDKVYFLQESGIQQITQKIPLKTGYELFVLHLQSNLIGNQFFSLIWNKSEEKISGKSFGWFTNTVEANLPFQLLQKPNLSFDDSKIILKSFVKNGNVYYAVIEHYLDYQGKNLINIETSSILWGDKPQLVTRKFDAKIQELTTFVATVKVGTVRIIQENGHRKLIKKLIVEGYEDILITSSGNQKEESFMLP
jgi:hypothetical protein